MTLLGRRKTSAEARRRKLEKPEYGWIWKPLLALLVIYLLVTLALGVWWSREPPPFDVEQATGKQRQGLENDQSGLPGARGTVSTASLMSVIETLTDKPGGYLRNDIAPPGLWLDNMPNWELGVLQQSRDLASALDEMASGDDYLEAAAERLQVGSRSWFYPSTEHRFEQALAALQDYLGGLDDVEAGLAPQGEPLAAWLQRVEKRLDSLTHRLSASVGEREASRELGISADQRPPATPWYRVDDIFFEARGSGWALLHFLRGLERDYADLLEAAEATEHWHQLITELEMTQRRIWSPLILNGSGFGLFANHSLMMANYTMRARELATELVELVDGVGVVEVHEAEEQQTVEPPVEEVSDEEANAGRDEAQPGNEAQLDGSSVEKADEEPGEEVSEESKVEEAGGGDSQ